MGLWTHELCSWMGGRRVYVRLPVGRISPLEGQMNEDLETRRIRANEARQFMQNPLFKESFESVAGYLNEVALSCDPDNKNKAQRIILSQQLLRAVRREIERKVEDGDMAAIQINEIERRGLKYVFRR